MATKVIMPKQGLQMTEGTITRWLVSEGGKVEEGQPLFEMETDKLTIEIMASVSGTLLKIVKAAGETVPITEIIAVIGEAGENISEFLTDSKADKEDISEEVKEAENQFINKEPDIAVNRIFITPRAKMTAKEKGIDYKNVKGTGPEGLIIERDIKFYKEESTLNKITPVAAKMAKEYGVNPSQVEGTGISGRIQKEDIQSFVDAKNSDEKSSSRKETLVPCKGMRKVIADRMMESLHNTAQANHRMKVDMTEAIRLREQLKNSGIKVSYNDILIKVVSKALLEFPYMNSSMVEEGILLKSYVNMGIAVSLENGLIVPNIKDAELLSLQEISKASLEVIEKAQKGKLVSEDYSGGTFTITNLGMFDIDEFTPIINPPECGILGLGKIEKTPVVEGEAVVIKPIMTMSLTYDHRVVDGALAAQFLQRVKQLLTNPYLLL